MSYTQSFLKRGDEARATLYGCDSLTGVTSVDAEAPTPEISTTHYLAGAGAVHMKVAAGKSSSYIDVDLGAGGTVDLGNAESFTFYLWVNYNGAEDSYIYFSATSNFAANGNAKFSSYHAGWNRITVKKSAFAGSPVWASIRYIRIKTYAAAGTDYWLESLTYRKNSGDLWAKVSGEGTVIATLADNTGQTASGTGVAVDYVVKDGKACTHVVSGDTQLSRIRVDLDVPQNATRWNSLEIDFWRPPNAERCNFIVTTSENITEKSQATRYVYSQGWTRVRFSMSDFTVSTNLESLRNIWLTVGAEAGKLTEWGIANIRVNSYERPKVCITFDDGTPTQYTAALAALAVHGFKASFYIIPSLIDTVGYLTTAQVQAIYDAGHDVCSHSYTHQSQGGACTYATALAEWVQARDWLTSRGFVRGECHRHGAWPSGAYNAAALQAAREAGMLSVRSTNQAVESHGVWAGGALCLNQEYIVNTLTTVALEALVKTLIGDGGIHFWMLHKIGNDGDAISVTAAVFAQHLAMLRRYTPQLDVVPVSELCNNR